ncbi:uncharacterized protein BJ171DRAFT_55793 [Polychytrium aggregatum]|uniref:uncharacterized protein n=1 Tax=Polychytrium aggregatum TaxID=110093 RepID=UPI0022FE8283|nr:uncharacterized protein BJ171DRAFT_55793 [Polychytrium aggregatum]KAI9205975.1 hypothetical protein BJ171DRAFT_55793 [Polychytrium aggregatum]
MALLSLLEIQQFGWLGTLSWSISCGDDRLELMRIPSSVSRRHFQGQSQCRSPLAPGQCLTCTSRGHCAVACYRDRVA